MYYFRLQELVRKEICRDLPSVVSISMSNLERAQKYFMMVAESAPLRPKSIDVTRKQICFVSKAIACCVFS